MYNVELALGRAAADLPGAAMTQANTVRPRRRPRAAGGSQPVEVSCALGHTLAEAAEPNP